MRPASDHAGAGSAARPARSVLVDRMSPEQARTVLTSGAPKLDPAVVSGLLAATGRWPLLLRLVSRILADYAQAAVDVFAQGAELCERMRRSGPTVHPNLPDETVVYDLPEETVHFDQLDDLLGDEDSDLDRATAGHESGPCEP